MPGSVIVSGARTPIGKLSGAYADLTAQQLGTTAIQKALEQAGISGDQVEYLIMGQVIQAGAGQNPARKAGTDAGIPMSVPSFTLNKVCLSGLDAIALADQMIQAGDYDVVVAGGMESMTAAPYLLPKARRGYKYGGGKILDATEYDALTDVYDQESMGASTDRFFEGDRPHPRGDGRVRGVLAPARGRRGEERPFRRRARPGVGPAAQG
jgi:acetyl-CoA C-acetyltransferase